MARDPLKCMTVLGAWYSYRDTCNYSSANAESIAKQAFMAGASWTAARVRNITNKACETALQEIEVTELDASQTRDIVR